MRIGFVVTNLAGGGAEKALLNFAAARRLGQNEIDGLRYQEFVICAGHR